MEQYLLDFENALRNIRPKFYFTNAIHDANNSLVGIDRVHQNTEAQFSAELYRQWYNLIEQENNIDRYEDLTLGFDLNKRAVESNLIGNKNKFRPDLILHESQENFDPALQLIFIEIKTALRPQVENDIKKLCYSIVEFSYQKAIFLTVNSDFEWVKNQISNVKFLISQENEFDESIWERIDLYHSLSDQNEINHEILSNI